jgi:transposase
MSRKIKYSKSFKLKAVKSVLTDNLSIIKVSDNLGLNKSDLKKWIKYYQKYGASGLESRTNNTLYSGDFKLSVINSVQQKGLSFSEASLKYNIPSHSTVCKWYSIYLREGTNGLYKERRGHSRSMKRKPKKPTIKSLTKEEELLQEIESLKAELALLKKVQALTQAKDKNQ